MFDDYPNKAAVPGDRFKTKAVPVVPPCTKMDVLLRIEIRQFWRCLFYFVPTLHLVLTKRSQVIQSNLYTYLISKPMFGNFIWPTYFFRDDATAHCAFTLLSYDHTLIFLCSIHHRIFFLTFISIILIMFFLPYLPFPFLSLSCPLLPFPFLSFPFLSFPSLPFFLSSFNLPFILSFLSNHF